MTASDGFLSAQRLGTSTEQFDGPKGDCPNAHTPHLLGINVNQRRAVVFRPRCKMWSCPVCGPANAWVWSFRASEGAHSLHDSGARLSFWTITPHERLSPGQSWWVMPKAWMKLQARIRRVNGPFQYFAVPELHKSRKVHIHMITTAEVSGRWLKNNGRECGFGYQNDKREVWETGGVVGYINKYLTKSLTVAGMPARTRRVRTSRGWPQLAPRDPPADWEFSIIPRKKPLLEFAQRLEDDGYIVHLLGSRSAWSVVSASDD